NNSRLYGILKRKREPKQIAVLEQLVIEQRRKHPAELGWFPRDQAQSGAFFQQLQDIEERSRDLEVGIDPEPDPRQRSDFVFAANRERLRSHAGDRELRPQQDRQTGDG